MSLELRRALSRPLSPETPGDAESEHAYIDALPPTDSGPGAWKFLLGCFVLEAVLWGFALSFGVFQDYYPHQPQFKPDADRVPIIGTVATSIYFLGAPLMAPLVKMFQTWQRTMVNSGSVLCILALLIASFMNSVPGLIATQGAMFGLGFLLLYFPVLSMLNEWFVARRGLAYGVLSAGGGFSGIGLPFLLEWLLSKYGHQTTLRIVVVAQSILVIPTLFVLKPRVPASHRSAIQRVDLQFFKNPIFWIFLLSNFAQGLAYYMPSLYLPTFASDLGLSSTLGALVLALNNTATILGQIGFGYLTDRYHNIFVILFISSFVGAVSAFTIWGFADSIERLIIFSLFWGFFAGGFPIFWPKFGSILSEDPQPVYSLMACTKGLGNIVTGPIASSLLRDRAVSWGYGLGKFENLIIFVGSLMLCSSLGILGWPLKHFKLKV